MALFNPQTKREIIALAPGVERTNQTTERVRLNALIELKTFWNVGQRAHGFGILTSIEMPTANAGAANTA